MCLVAGSKRSKDVYKRQVEKTVIDRAVRIVYRPYIADPRPENMSLLEDLYDEIKRQPEPEAQRIAAALELYVHGSLNVFNHRTNVDIDVYKRQVIYFPALPCEYREQGTTAEFTGIL